MDFVDRIIRAWDPIGLVPCSPEDEYHSEIQQVKQLLIHTDDIAEITEGLRCIFTESFGNDIFLKTQIECEQIAHSLLAGKEACDNR